MHRSGTSLLGGLLQRLGVSLPGQTIRGDIHNPEGYFEWDQVVAVQERLLVDLQRWWPSLDGTLPMPNAWLEHPATLQARSQLFDLLSAEIKSQHGIWAIKDPRCSRLLPLWIGLARELQFPLHIVLSLRDPAEVSTSLVKRDGPLTGMDPTIAQQLWWRHNLELLHTARDASLPISIVSFSGWFQDPHAELGRLLFSLPKFDVTDAQRTHALSLIRSNLRRSITPVKPTKIFPVVRDLYLSLLRKLLSSPLPSPTPSFGLRHIKRSAFKLNKLLRNPSDWTSWLNHHLHYPAPCIHCIPPLGSDPLFKVIGSSWLEIEPHQCLDHLSLSDLSDRQIDSSRSHSNYLYCINDPSAQGSLNLVAINLEMPSPDLAEQWLSELRSYQLIFDPQPSRVLLMRELGLPAWWVNLDGPTNGWLNQYSATSPDIWGMLLGLAPPSLDSLIVLGALCNDFNSALTAEAISSSNLKPSIQYLPGWSELIIDDVKTGLARAGWFSFANNNSCGVFLSSELSEQRTPADLRAHYLGQDVFALAEERSSRFTETLYTWSSTDECQPASSVLVSLYNYASRICSALDSVLVQTAQYIELIVVDDASNDDGVEKVLEWIKSIVSSTNHPFVRILFLRHASNSGLAATRNTGFASARAKWCFVLDADNILYPNAIESCMNLTANCAANMAVVHPLLAVNAEIGRSDDQRSLVSTASWQSSRLLSGNVVDAMALIRRKAWQEVGGYTHIEGGWEDFDFWCKLIEADFFGVQCPYILAEYRSHAQSMTFTATNKSWRALSNTLQKRHPWLDLPLALI